MLIANDTIMLDGRADKTQLDLLAQEQQLLTEKARSMRNGINLLTEELSESVENSLNEISEQIQSIWNKMSAERTRLQQERKISEVRDIFPFVTKEEAAWTLKQYNESAELAISSINYPLIQKSRRKLAISLSAHVVMSDAAREVHERRMKLRQDKKDHRKKLRTVGRLLLDDALAQLKRGGQAEDAFEGWSEARISAYNQIETNPNAYYYRFNAPGQKQRMGAFSASEEKQFFERLKECGTKGGKWGLFSIPFVGRVGYQCANFYRKLVKEGRVTEHDYFFDAEGEIVHKSRFKDATIIPNRDREQSSLSPRRARSPLNSGKSGASSSGEHRGGASQGDDAGETASQTARRPRKRKKSAQDEADEQWMALLERGEIDENELFNLDEECYDRLFGGERKGRGAERRERADRKPTAFRGGKSDDSKDASAAVTDLPDELKNYVDPITFTPVERPAVCPCGIVADWSTWMQALNNQTGQQKNICPFTRANHSHRSLVLLTTSNFAEHADRLNLTS